MTAKTLEPAEKKVAYVWCRIPGQYMGRDFDRGQVIPKLGSSKDIRLKELGYLPDYEPDGDLHECDECGAVFTEDVWRVGHIEKRHHQRVMREPQRMDRESEADYHERVAQWHAVQDDVALRQEDRAISQMGPHLEKTLASQ